GARAVARRRGPLPRRSRDPARRLAREAHRLPALSVPELNQALVNDPAFNDWICKRTPAGRWGRVEELCGAAVFLASSAADFINGQTLFVDGGLTSTV
ncbi:SDR family oxidoreductase, partial [Burkholderia gladioli]|nr:SDR family oxidoreductase [Burkholderia gladioli]